MIEVYCDGACEPTNPGGTASFGAYIVRDREVLDELWGVIGSGPTMSNNVAEFGAVAKALLCLSSGGLSGEPIKIFSDSQLVVNVLSGKWPIRQGLYVPQAIIAKELSRGFKNIEYQWIPREKNTFADELSVKALKEVGIGPRRRTSKSEGPA